ncbi:MAG: ribbon-helix-helix domain-containing protein [Dermatophilaceae bacterium]
MKLSISLPPEDLAALDRYAEAAGVTSRSAAIRQAIRQLSHPELDDAYAAAWDEWAASGEAAAWEETEGDGLTDAPR